MCLISGSLFIAIRPEIKESFHMPAMLLLQKTLPQLSCKVFLDLLQYIIEGSIKSPVYECWSVLQWHIHTKFCEDQSVDSKV